MFELIKCANCNGSGKVIVEYGYFSKNIECHYCNGSCHEIKFKPLLPSLFNIIFSK